MVSMLLFTQKPEAQLKHSRGPRITSTSLRLSGGTLYQKYTLYARNRIIIWAAVPYQKPPH